MITDLKNKKIVFFESDFAKQIVEDYKNNETASFRSLEKKYHLSRKHIKQILKYYNVEFKDVKQVRKKVWEEKIARGERHPNFGKNRICNYSNTHWYFYKGNHFQGSFEFKFGLWLENKGIKFLCHLGVKIFEYIDDKGKTTCYHPDFYLPEIDEYVEIKGYFPEKSKKKLEIIKRTYPDLKLNIYTVDILKKLSVFDIDKQLKINIEEFRYDLKNKIFYVEQLKNKISKEQFLDKIIGESKNITKIAEELNESKHLVYILYKIYQIPKIGSKEFCQYKLDYFINKLGKDITNDVSILNFNQFEVKQKYKLPKGMTPKIFQALKLVSKRKKDFLLLEKRTIDFKQKIIDLYCSNQSFSTIAKNLHIPRVFVKQVLIDNNCLRTEQEECEKLSIRKQEKNKKRREVLIEQKLENNKEIFVKMFYEGKPLSKLAEFFKVPILCVELFVNMLNLEISKTKNYKKCIKCGQYVHRLGFGSHYKAKHSIPYREETLC